jgi:transposase
MILLLIGKDGPESPRSWAIHVNTLYKWRKGWRREGEVVPASKKEPEDWSANEVLTLVLGTAGLNATELRAYCRERCLVPKQV